MKDFSDIHEGCLIAIFDRYDGSYELGIVTSCGINDYHGECQVELNNEYKKAFNRGDWLPYFLKSKNDYKVIFTADEIKQRLI